MENMPGKVQGHRGKIKGDLTYFIQHGRNGRQQGQYFIVSQQTRYPDSICNYIKYFYDMSLKLYVLNFQLI